MINAHRCRTNINNDFRQRIIIGFGMTVLPSVVLTTYDLRPTFGGGRVRDLHSVAVVLTA